MTIYVFAEAYTPTEDYADVVTEVFTDKQEAIDHLYQRSQSYVNHPEDGDHWEITYEDSMYFHALYDGDQDEVVMNIVKFEI